MYYDSGFDYSGFDIHVGTGKDDPLIDRDWET